MNKKYILTEKTLNWYGRTLHRIKALRSFNDVEEGDLGGWVESEENLSHDGICWVYGEAKVYDNAKVYGNAQIYGNAKVCNNARIYGNAVVYDNTWIYGNAQIYGNAKVCNNARIYGNAVVYDNTWIYDNAEIYGNAKVYGYAWIYDNARVYNNAKISGKTNIFGKARISQTANISKTEDYLTVGPLGSRDDFTTFFKGENGDILVNCGCFSGTIEEFKKRVEEVHGESEYGKEYLSIISFAQNKY